MPAVEPSEPRLPPFNHTPAPYQGPSKEEVYALRKQYLSPGGCAPLKGSQYEPAYALAMLP